MSILEVLSITSSTARNAMMPPNPSDERGLQVNVQDWVNAILVKLGNRYATIPHGEPEMLIFNGVCKVTLHLIYRKKLPWIRSVSY